MVPHSDYFDSADLNPEWSFSGYTPANTHSLAERPGWFRLSPRGKANTIVKHEGEYNYSLITRLEFNPEVPEDQAGFWLFNGLETLYAKLYCTANDSGKQVIRFGFTGQSTYEEQNTIGNTLWLKLYRDYHMLSGYFSADGVEWTQVGEAIDVSDMDKNQPDYNGWIGTQLGLYVQGKSADFDLFLYRDAYSPIKAQPAANQFGTLRVVNGTSPAYLDSINNNDWALYAGVEFGGKNYYKKADSLVISASSASEGGMVEVWLDSIDTGQKIAECAINNTGGWNDFHTFTTGVDSVSGMHDVYLKFSGSGRLFRIDWFMFTGHSYTPTVGIKENNKIRINAFKLNQNYPNPFNPLTHIDYSVPHKSYVTLRVFNILGQEVVTLFDGQRDAGNYTAIFNGRDLVSGIYLYRLQAGNFMSTKKLILIK
jgi:hypothetical protein